jgi:hypothetical protein
MLNVVIGEKAVSSVTLTFNELGCWKFGNRGHYCDRSKWRSDDEASGSSLYFY